MRKYLLLFASIFVFISLSAQQNFISFSNMREATDEKQVVREVVDNGNRNVIFEYDIPGAYFFDIEEEGYVFQRFFIDGFSHTHEVGKPAIPSLNHVIAVPRGAKVSIRILESQSMEYDNMLIYPSLRAATDRYGDPEPPFEIDWDFYGQNTVYPANVCEIIESNMIRGTELAIIRISPVQYYPAERKIKVYSYIRFAVEFEGGSYFLDKRSSREFAERMRNMVINNNDIAKESQELLSKHDIYRSGSNDAKNYIIITTPTFQRAADSLALWKMQLGYSTEIICKPTWTTDQVRHELSSRYESWTPRPDYFVIIGDNEDVPGIDLRSSYNNALFASDHYYGCFDGPEDYIADMASGRISVRNETEAMLVVQKIINYERNPVTDSSFYKTGLNAAQFQDDNEDGYADRRFSLTSEDVKTYLETNTDIEVTRVYATDATVNPRFWNKGLFASGEPLPEYLRKPTFPWTGSITDIAAAINKGVLYVLHRDHGYAGGTGWHMPKFVTSDINSRLTNGNKLPVVFSINCHTGEYQLPNCFAEAFLRKANGGAVGVFAAAYTSYSGYNDALSLGFFDAIWANPGLVPNFTGSGGIKNPTLSPHGPIYTMGDVLNQGLIRMVETWGVHRHTFELFHYFGDPAMKIWTIQPQPILSAMFPDSILCDSKTLIVTDCSVKDALVTLVVDDKLIAKAQLSDGKCTLNFNAVRGDYVILTISKTNYKPYIVKIPIYGGCPRARFIAESNKFCVNNPITFTNTSMGLTETFQWDFGKDAIPKTANTKGPHNVVYSSPGNKTVNLFVSGSAGNSTYISTVFIEDNCSFLSPANGKKTVDHCFGYMYDNGGTSFYSNRTDGIVSISPPGAASVSLQFSYFDFENGYDSLIIYDGADTLSPIIGSYTGTTLPNGGSITSTGPSITLRQRTDPGLQRLGYKLYFFCNHSNKAPVANIMATKTESCNGHISFRDMSRNYPGTWNWNFGDGQSSSSQHPEHLYTQNGHYTVKLIVSNKDGVDTIVKEKYVSVEYPNDPYIIPGSSCSPGPISMYANCQGTIEWYDSLTGGTLLATGTSYTTPATSEDLTYYVECNASEYRTGAKDRNIGTGGFYNQNTEQGMIFSCYKPIILKSVMVVASGAKNRKFILKDSEGFTIKDTTIMVAAGTQRVQLNFDIPTGNNMKLVTPGLPNFWRNTRGATYPYEIPGTLAITDNTYGDLYYYYFFYDWEVVDPDVCNSQRIPITAHIHSTAPQASFAVKDSGLYYTFTNNSTGFAQFSWYFGDGNFDTLSRYVAHHKYAQAGQYTVELNAFNACGVNKTVNQVNVVNAINESDLASGIIIFPNPNDGRFFIKTNDQSILSIAITSVDGKLVYFDQPDGKNGDLTEIKLQDDIRKGLYLIYIQTEKGRSVFRIIKQ